MKKIIKKMFICFMVIGIGISVFISCKDKEKGIVNISMAGSYPVSEKKVLNNYYKKFTEDTGIVVKLDYDTATNQKSKITAEQTSKNYATDIVYIGSNDFAQYKVDKQVIELDDVINKSGSTLIKTFDEIIKVDGKTYFALNTYDMYLLVAHVDTLMYLPGGKTKDDVMKGNISWEEFADWAIAIKNGTGIGYTGFATAREGSQLPYSMVGIAGSYGGDFAVFNDNGFSKAASLLKKMGDANALYSGEPYAQLATYLANGSVKLAYDHVSRVGQGTASAPDQFVVGPCPTGDSGRASTLGANVWGIPNNAPNMTNAKTFINWALQPENNYFYSSLMSQLSPILEVERELTSDDAVILAALEAAKNTKMITYDTALYEPWNDMKLIYNDIYQDIVIDKVVLDTSFYQKYQDKVTALLNAAKNK